MTLKERIEAFVKQQGNQVGAGAELAAILNDIVDSIPGAYTLPPATAETLGGVKVGSGLAVTEQGVLSASGGGSEPLIVEGRQSDTIFIPNESQPTKAEARSAFNSGRMVIIKYLDEDEVENTALCIAIYQDDLYFGGLSTLTW